MLAKSRRAEGTSPNRRRGGNHSNLLCEIEEEMGGQLRLELQPIDEIKDANITGAGDISFRTKNGIFALAEEKEESAEMSTFQAAFLNEVIYVTNARFKESKEGCSLAASGDFRPWQGSC